MYMRMTKAEMAAQKTVSGRVTDLSSMAMRAREALPESVAAVFVSR